MTTSAPMLTCHSLDDLVETIGSSSVTDVFRAVNSVCINEACGRFLNAWPMASVVVMFGP